VHELVTKSECNNMHGERIKIAIYWFSVYGARVKKHNVIITNVGSHVLVQRLRCTCKEA